MPRLKQTPNGLPVTPSGLQVTPQSPRPRRYRGLINTAKWQRLRAAFINERRQAMAERGEVLRCPYLGLPLNGTNHAANSPVVHHVVAHRNDPELFWDQSNWQVVSKKAHDTILQAREKMNGPARG